MKDRTERAGTRLILSLEPIVSVDEVGRTDPAETPDDRGTLPRPNGGFGRDHESEATGNIQTCGTHGRGPRSLHPTPD